MQNQVFCRFCGKVMPADSQFCPHCGKSQGGPVAAAAPSMEAPAEQEQPSVMTGTGVQKPSKAPIIFMVIAGVFVLCCVGLVLSQVFMREYFGGTAPEIVAAEMTALSSSATSIVLEPTLQTMQTAAAEQQAILDEQKVLAIKWTPPFLILFIAERQYEDAIVTFQRIESGIVSREEFESAIGVPDAYYVVFLTIFQAEEFQVDLKGTVFDFDPSVAPFVAGLEDDYQNPMLIKLEWIAKGIDANDAIVKLQEGQAALANEREKMMQAAKMDGMTDEVYERIQASLKEQWPGLKAKYNELGIQMMTPQP